MRIIDWSSDVCSSDLSAPATIVLVHGAFHGPWCFDRVRGLLDERGISTIAPELPLETMAGDVAVVTAAIDAAEGPVTLLGHSYGGTVITWAGEHPKADRTVAV